MNDIEIDKIAFEGPPEPYKGFSIKATYLKQPKGDALIEIMRDGKLHREFLYPAYKIYNLSAHFEEIVDGELEGHNGGYRAASWNGITPTGPAQPLPRKRPNYDAKSYELAVYFLDAVDGATDADKLELAQAVQEVCEEHCRDVARRVEAHMGRAG